MNREELFYLAPYVFSLLLSLGIFLYHGREICLSTFRVGNAETEIQRVIKPDGKITWQEWTDQAIRDDWNKLIEIRSIGRDITAHQQTEENSADCRKARYNSIILICKIKRM